MGGEAYFLFGLLFVLLMFTGRFIYNAVTATDAFVKRYGLLKAGFGGYEDEEVWLMYGFAAIPIIIAWPLVIIGAAFLGISLGVAKAVRSFK